MNKRCMQFFQIMYTSPPKRRHGIYPCSNSKTQHSLISTIHIRRKVLPNRKILKVLLIVNDQALLVREM